jgi:alkylation response protein AidB-like acyl-CoA dehydrogenase
MTKDGLGMDRFELRRQDFALDEDQEAVQQGFAEFFAKECPTTLVREAEPLGFDAALWKKLAELGIAGMSLPAAVGGDEATLVDLVVVAEEFGRRVAPVPLVSHVVATRLLATAGADPSILDPAMSGESLATVAMFPIRDGVRQLVPDAAIAANVIGYDGSDLVLYAGATTRPLVVNEGSTPLAWWQPAADQSSTVLLSGAPAATAYETARREWKLLMAAALIGMTEASLELAVEFAKTRETMGVPIGALQGVAFPLTDVAIGIAGGRNLVRKAAWFAENDPSERPELPLLAFDFAARTATYGTTTSAHMQGGLGFTIEADASLFFLRSKGWSALGGDPADDAKAAARILADAR